MISRGSKYALKKHYHHYKTCKLVQALEEKRKKTPVILTQKEDMRTYCLKCRDKMNNIGSKR